MYPPTLRSSCTAKILRDRIPIDPIKHHTLEGKRLERLSRAYETTDEFGNGISGEFDRLLAAHTSVEKICAHKYGLVYLSSCGQVDYVKHLLYPPSTSVDGLPDRETSPYPTFLERPGRAGLEAYGLFLLIYCMLPHKAKLKIV